MHEIYYLIRLTGGRVALKNQTRLALAAVLMLVIAGCSCTSTENSASPGLATDSAAENTTPNLDFAAKCPAVHYEKLQAWTDVQIMQHEKIKEVDITLCKQWIAKHSAGCAPPMTLSL